MSLNADGSSCRSCSPESSNVQQNHTMRGVVLTLHYLQEKFNVIFGKLRLAEQVPDEVVDEDTSNDLEIV